MLNNVKYIYLKTSIEKLENEITKNELVRNTLRTLAHSNHTKLGYVL